MNITRAYNGALAGLRPLVYDSHIRTLQTAIAVQLATMRRAKYHVTDSSVVSNADLARLKYRGEISLK